MLIPSVEKDKEDSYSYETCQFGNPPFFDEFPLNHRFTTGELVLLYLEVDCAAVKVGEMDGIINHKQFRTVTRSSARASLYAYVWYVLTNVRT